MLSYVQKSTSASKIYETVVLHLAYSLFVESWWLSLSTMPRISFRRLLPMVAAFDARNPLSKSTCAHWDGASGVQPEPHRNYQITMNKSSPICIFEKLVSSMISESQLHFESTQTRCKPITRWAGSGHGIRKVKSKSRQWDLTRSEHSRWFPPFLLAERCSPFKPYSMARQQPHALLPVLITTRKPNALALNLSRLDLTLTGQPKKQCGISSMISSHRTWTT